MVNVSKDFDDLIEKDTHNILNLMGNLLKRYYKCGLMLNEYHDKLMKFRQKYYDQDKFTKDTIDSMKFEIDDDFMNYFKDYHYLHKYREYLRRNHIDKCLNFVENLEQKLEKRYNLKDFDYV